MNLIVVRHAEREDIKDSETAHLAGLTKKGIDDSVSFGAQLHGKLNVKVDNLFTSYVERCQDTGHLILSSHALDVFDESINFFPAKSHNNLLTLGYVKLEKRIEWLDFLHEMFENNDMDYPKYFQKWAALNILTHKTVDEYSIDFFSRYFNMLSTNLIVTHDSNIGPIMYYLASRYNFQIEECMARPNYLCGFCISSRGTRESIYWLNFEDNEIKTRRLI